MPTLTIGLAKAIEAVLAEYHPPGSTIPGPLADLRREYSAAMFSAASHPSDPPICYMGHEDCYDNHTSERLADEADWEQERLNELNGKLP